jgi:hypothetical protein
MLQECAFQFRILLAEAGIRGEVGHLAYRPVETEPLLR